MRSLIATLMLIASPAAFAGSVHYVELVNTAKSSIVGFEVADAGGANFRSIGLGAGVQGGGDSTTIAIDSADSCLRDLRTTFKDGRVLVQKDFDVCKYRSYHTGQYLRHAEPVRLAAQP